MFKYGTEQPQQLVDVTLDGRPASLPKGMNVAAALLGMGEIISRISPASRKPCGPHCLMGVCYECMMEIDGIRRQACMTPVTSGMVINRFLDAEHGETPCETGADNPVADTVSTAAAPLKSREEKGVTP